MLAAEILCAWDQADPINKSLARPAQASCPSPAIAALLARRTGYSTQSPTAPEPSCKRMAVISAAVSTLIRLGLRDDWCHVVAEVVRLGLYRMDLPKADCLGILETAAIKIARRARSWHLIKDLTDIALGVGFLRAITYAWKVLRIVGTR